MTNPKSFRAKAMEEAARNDVVPTGNPPVDVTLTVRIKADYLNSGRPLTAGAVERDVRRVLRDYYNDLADVLTVKRAAGGEHG